MSDARVPQPGERRLHVVHLGMMPYAEAWTLQREVAAARIAGSVPNDVLLLVEHPAVITLGRSANAANLRADTASLAARGVPVFDVERGGDITLHAPGQIVGYPIIDLREHREDLHWYLRTIESALIRALATAGVPAEARPALTGVWTSGRKIASIGVHAKHWVTWHGFALNVTTDLAWFDTIVPCGIEGVEMTSVARELGWTASRVDAEGAELVTRVSAALAEHVALAFGLRARSVSRAELARIIDGATAGIQSDHSSRETI